MRSVRRVMTSIVLVSLVAAACGSEVGDGSADATVPTAEQIAARLLAPGDLTGTWAVNPGPDDGLLPASGLIPDEARDMLPRVELCDAATAEQRAAASNLEWQAYRQLDMTPDDPIDPPADRVGHMVFVQEFLLAGEVADVEESFGLLRDGMRACLGEVDTGEEGPGTATEMSTPEVGDDRYGVLTTVEEAGGAGVWLLHNTLVRKGNVLMSVDVVDIRLGDVPPLFTIDEVGAIVQTATDRLG